MSKTKYMLIDIAVFTFIVSLLECINLISYKAFNEVFSISIMLPICLIVLMRWKIVAVIPSATAGAVFALMTGVSELYLCYTVGNMFIALNVVWLIKPKTQDLVKNNLYFTILYFLSGFLFIILGRSLMALILNKDFFSSILHFIISDAFNACMGLIILLIARRQKGLFENQNEYLLRLQAEKEEDI